MLIRLLGSPLVSRDGVEVRVDGAKTRSLLALLSLHRGEVVSVDRMADELWYHRPPQSADGTLHAHVSRLRRALAQDSSALRTVRPGYRLDLGTEQLDLSQFETLHRIATDSARRGDHRRACDAWRKAHDLWQGDLADRLCGFASAAMEVDRLQELRLQAAEGLMDSRIAAGEARAAIVDLLAMTAASPGRERSWILLMTALYHEGRQTEALSAYSRARQFLLEEYGVEPGAELRATHAAVLGQTLRSAAAVTAPSDAVPLRLPRQLRRRSTETELVGRSAQLEMLNRWSTSRPPNRLAVISGAPGMGKTRLAEEAAVAMHQRAGVVLWGSCRADRQLPYEPVVVALRDHLELLDPSDRPVVTGRGGQLLARLLPRLRTDGFHDGAGLQIFDQYELFESVVGLIQSLAAGRQILLVVDDFQWVDDSSMQLIQHLVRHPAPVQVLTTLRAVGHDQAGERLRVFFDQLQHDQLLDEVIVDALGDHEARRLLQASCRCAEQVVVNDAVMAATGGNPYLIGQVATSLTDNLPVSDDPDAVSRLLQVTLVERLSRLGPDVMRLLQLAAVVGPELDVAFIAAVSTQPAEAVRAGLEAAAAAGAVIPVGPAGSSYRFAHELTRQALFEIASPAQRSTWHRQIAEQLQNDRGPGWSFAEIVRHLGNSARADAALACHFAELAAEEAFAVLGFHEAAEHFRTAIDFTALDAGEDLHRCRLHLGAGEALLAAYAVADSREHFVRSARIALRRAAEPELGRALRGIIAGTEFGVVDEEAIGLFEAASTGSWSDATVALILAGQARVLPGDDPGRAELIDRAKASADKTADEQIRVFVLATVLLTDWRPANLDWRRRTVAATLRIAERHGASELAAELLNLKAAAAAEAGDLAEADADVARLTGQASRSRRPFLLALSSMRLAGAALFRGDYAEAERHSTAMIEAAGSSPNFVAARSAHVFAAGRDRDRLAAVVPQLRDVVGITRRADWSSALALALAELDHLDEARELLRQHAHGSFTSVPSDWLWLPTLVHFAETAVLTGDTAAAEDLCGLLAPYRNRNVVVAHGLLAMGAVARVHAALLALLGRHEAGRREYELALRLNCDWRATPWVVRTKLAFADLLERDDSAAFPGGPDHCRLRREAVAQARTIGMHLSRPAPGCAPASPSPP